MTPPTWWSYPVWVVSAVLTGLIVATFAGGPEADTSGPQRVVGGGLLSVLAVGCPVCNKVVVAAIGVSGALDYWAPLQPLIGVASIAVLLAGLLQRLSGSACPVPARTREA